MEIKNVATANNLRRKSRWADHVQMLNGVPLPSWVELSLTELCNRSAGSPKACRFCPRIDSDFYPNVPLHMAMSLASRIADDLRSMEYEGAVVLCGYGEPLLHPKINEIVGLFHGLHLEIVTNGDRLTAQKIRELSDEGCAHIVVSMYDGPEQIEKFTAMFAEAGCANYTLRDRWHTEEDDFGLKLTNRAGTTDAGNQPAADETRPCFYPSYAVMADFNGDVLLCCQDWSKRVKLGNLAAQTLLTVWTGPIARKHRMRLLDGKRNCAPCKGCNAAGTLHGANHADAWRSAGR